MKIVIAILAVLLWIGLLEILRRAGLKFWRYLAGSCGAFLILMILVRPVVTVPLARLVTALAGIIGKVTGVFQAYFRYGVIFIESAKGAITVNSTRAHLYRCDRNTLHDRHQCIQDHGHLSVHLFLRNGFLLCGTYVHRKDSLLSPSGRLVFLCVYETSDQEDSDRRVLLQYCGRQDQR